MTASLLTPHAYTAEGFRTAVRELAPTVAVFDCDGTLWSRDAGSSFMRWTIETGLLSREAVEWLDGRYRGYLGGEVSEAAICGEMVAVYRGLRESELRDAAATFFGREIQPSLFAEMASLVEELRTQGVELWAVSSTCDWVIEAGVAQFGIPASRVLASRVGVLDGVITDKVLDVPTDQGKVEALRRAGITAPDAVFGNSVHDAAMLSIARQGFPVNPTEALSTLSAERGWRIFQPARPR